MRELGVVRRKGTEVIKVDGRAVGKEVVDELGRDLGADPLEQHRDVVVVQGSVAVAIVGVEGQLQQLPALDLALLAQGQPQKVLLKVNVPVSPTTVSTVSRGGGGGGVRAGWGKV